MAHSSVLICVSLKEPKLPYQLVYMPFFIQHVLSPRIHFVTLHRSGAAELYTLGTLWSRYDRPRQPLKSCLANMGITKVVIGCLWYPQDFFFRFGVLSCKKGHFVSHLTLLLQKIEPFTCCWLYSSWAGCYDKELCKLLIKYIMAKSNNVAPNYAQWNSKRKLPILKIYLLYTVHLTIKFTLLHMILFLMWQMYVVENFKLMPSCVQGSFSCINSSMKRHSHQSDT